MRLEYTTAFGSLYRADCLEFLGTVADESVATFFADPPFNLKKDYGSKGSDDIPVAEYLRWCESWLTEGVRVLSPGGALFVYNLPKWLMPIGTFLSSLDGMTFKHWIAIDKAHSLPIPNRLSTSHYGMLYFKRYKNRLANQLAPVILERVILLTTNPGDLVCDPFAGAGTTAYVSEKLGRCWVTADLNDTEPARLRLLEVANGTDPSWRSSQKRIMESASHVCEPVGSLFSDLQL